MIAKRASAAVMIAKRASAAVMIAKRASAAVMIAKRASAAVVMGTRAVLTGRLPWLLLLALLCACGTQGGEINVQMSTWPQSGLGGFQLLTAEQAPNLQVPFVLQPALYTVDQPAALSSGDTLRVFCKAARRSSTTSFIGLAVAPVLEQGAQDVTQALQADQPWEGGGLGAPSLVSDPADQDRIWLLYQGQADGGLGLATGTPDGSLTKLRQPLLPATLAGGPGHLMNSAAAGRDDDHLLVYFARPDQSVWRAAASLDAVRRFISAPDMSIDAAWQITGPVLRASDCTVPLSSVESAPGAAIAGVGAQLVRTPAGRWRYDLFLTVMAQQGSARTVCAAASYDGLGFLVAPAPAILLQQQEVPSRAAVLSYRGQPLMLLGLSIGQPGIAAGLIP